MFITIKITVSSELKVLQNETKNKTAPGCCSKIMAASGSESRPERSQYMMLSDIRPEDMEEGVIASFDHDGVVDDEELLNYIRKHTNNTEGYSDFYFGVLQDIFINPNLCKLGEPYDFMHHFIMNSQLPQDYASRIPLLEGSKQSNRYLPCEICKRCKIRLK